MNEKRLQVEFPKALFISANDRLHWAEKAKRTKDIRTLAMLAARERDPAPIPCLVDVTIHRPKGGTLRDAENSAPTVKACLDGLRDAQVLAEDDRKHVVAITYRIAPKNRADDRYGIEINFIDQEVAF